ncbi:caspase, EACC1-associated type [Streptomyces sp. NEAU-174]|uniref:caspase, EACC1-associated type n=1 Tax=Streptomyces sp. NEAU-174 TaxID=3458254 RepID=UPI00404518BA
MSHLPDPERSRVVLVGGGRFSAMAELPAVAANVASLCEMFTSEEVWGLPAAHCLVLRDPREARAISRAVKQAAREASDTLLFYYAGHGLIDSGTGELHLALRDSQPDEVYDTAVPYQWIRRALTASPAVRRIVILDCCYSGRALGAMSEGLDLAEIDGTYLLAAAAENALALAPPGEMYTAFTGELVSVLHRGLPEADQTLTLNNIYEATLSSLRAAERPAPQCRDRNTLGMLPFAPNQAYRPHRSPAAPTDPTMRRFVADMAHELRTPLTAITAVCEVLEEETERLGPPIEPAIRLVTAESRRLNDLVEKLMEIARIEAGTARLDEEEIEVTQALRDCISAHGGAEGITLESPYPVRACLDLSRFEIIAGELIENAIRHGGTPVTVTVRPDTAIGVGARDLLSARPADFEITVADSGNGIPKDVLPVMFDRFFKGPGPRSRTEGSGLGLSLAQENAHLMGGNIRAANLPDKGAEFALRLPYEAPNE